MNARKNTHLGVPVRCTTTGEVFASIKEASQAKHVEREAIYKCCRGRQATSTGLGWEYLIPPEEQTGPGTKWTPEEEAILLEHVTEPIKLYMHLLPGRSAVAIQNRKMKLSQDRPMARARTENDLNRETRPLTDETAYQCRIEYADKLARGYTPEAAIMWVAEANERTVEIVRDAIFNPAHDEQVEICKRKYTDPKDNIVEGADLAEILAELGRRVAEAKQGYKGNPVIGTNLRTGKMFGFVSISATQEAGFNPTHVTECLKGKKKSHHGFKWEKADEHRQHKTDD